MKKQSIVLLMVLFVMVLTFTSCDVLSQYIPFLHEHTWVEATCTAPKTCSTCNATEGEVLGHAEEVLEGKDATCTETGLTEGKKCSACDEILTAQEIIPVKAHTEVTVAGKDATCTDTGLTEGKKCSVCDEVTVKQEVIPVKAHTEVTVAGEDATCTKTGLTEGKKCSVCDEVTVKQEVIPVKAHTEEIVAGKDATCTDTGLTEGKKCSVCGKELLAQTTTDALGHDMSEATCTEAPVCKRDNCDHTEGEALGHSYDEGTVTTNPGCESEGVKLISCTREGCDHSYEEKIDATGHSYTDTVVAPTCIEKGYTLHVCGNCGDSYKDSETDLVDHTYVGVVTTEPGCETTGIKTFTCSVDNCGNSYTEVISANGHSEVAHEGKAASCTENGWEAYVTCENCDYTTYKEISAKGHKGGKATCSALAVCDNCGEEYGNYDLVNGHNYGEADCDSPATCTLCGTATGEAIGHADLDPVDHKCDRCEKELSEHIDDNKDHKCDNGCSEAIGTCEDADFDHDCDYGCDKYFGEHIDDNKDHACDYGCLEAIGAHADGDDANHTCDYGCKKPVAGEVCVDEDRNHRCDECFGNVGGECQDDKDAQDEDHLCDYCNEPVGEDCYGGTASCTKKAVCTECGKEYGELIAHSYSLSVATENALKSKATCTESAVYYYSCVCGEIDKSENANSFINGEPLGHEEIILSGKEATCKEAGITEGKMCSVCGDTLVEQTEISKLAHTEEIIAGVTPTCTETGLTEGKICSVCGETITAQEQLPALGHKYGDAVYTWSEDNSTCTATTVCGNDASHVISESATVITVTLNVSGEKVTFTYNVEFANGAFAAQSKTVDGEMTVENKIATVNAPAIAGRVASHDYVKFDLHNADETHEFTIYYSELDVWDGTSVSESLEGSGTAEDPYLIQSAADLKLIANTVNALAVKTAAYSGQYFKMTKSIDLGGAKNFHIGTGSGWGDRQIFGGYLDGNNCTIRGIDNSLALFGCVEGGWIKNLSIYGKVKTTKASNGALVGYLFTAELHNITNYANVEGAGNVGGVVGNMQQSANNTSSNLVNYGTVTGASTNVGGIAGLIGGGLTDSTNWGTVIGNGGKAAGVAAAFNWNGSLANCSNYGDVNSTWAVGGILGFVTKDKAATVSSCKNFGHIHATGTSNGGIFGLSEGTAVVNIENCVNYGEVSGITWGGGGIAGDINAGYVSGCENFGNVSGDGQLGGIAGKSKVKVSGSTNYGNITATVDIVGGICGDTTAAITGCENKGVVAIASCKDLKIDQISPSDVTKTDCINNGSIVYAEHTLTHVDATDATCEAEGNVAYDNCSVCNRNYDAEGNLLESVVVPAGHKDNDGDLKCDSCGTSLCDHIPADAVKENEKAATCTVAGSYDNVVYCSKCKSELSRDVIAVDALGHDMQGTVEGTKKTYTCENGCGETYVKYLVTVNHLNLDGSVAVEADVYEFDNETVYTVNAKTIEGYVASHDYVKGHILSAGGTVNIYYSEVDVWDGTSVSTSLSGSGTEEDPYLIQSGADLAYLKSIVDAAKSYTENPCSGQYFKMTKSIDLNGANFMIGYHSTWNMYDGFAGIFDGNNCSIRGMAIDVASGSAGLFGCVKDTGTLKNLSVYGSVKGTAVAGGAVAYARGTVENVTNYATVIGGSTVGGVAGDVSAVNITYIGNCVNYGDVVATANYAGGVAGSGGSQMTACANFGNVKGVTYVGGICGQTKTMGTIKECNNYGTVEGTSSVDAIAGLAKKTLENCNNYGTVIAG